MNILYTLSSGLEAVNDAIDAEKIRSSSDDSASQICQSHWDATFHMDVNEYATWFDKHVFESSPDELPECLPYA